MVGVHNPGVCLGKHLLWGLWLADTSSNYAFGVHCSIYTEVSLLLARNWTQASCPVHFPWDSPLTNQNLPQRCPADGLFLTRMSLSSQVWRQVLQSVTSPLYSCFLSFLSSPGDSMSIFPCTANAVFPSAELGQMASKKQGREAEEDNGSRVLNAKKRKRETYQ